MDIDKDHICGLDKGQSIWKSRSRHKAKVNEENGSGFDALYQGALCDKTCFGIGSHALTFWFCFILSNLLT